MSVIYTSGGAGVTVADATTVVSGKVRLATIAEAGGTSEAIAITPAGLQAELAGVVGGMVYRGTITPAQILTDLDNASQGDVYRISQTGSSAGYDWTVGDTVLVNADMGGSFDANKINRLDTTDGDLATVAVSGDYNDLSGTPTLATVATTGAYTDLSGTPTLATVATTGAYSDLSGTPTLATVATTGDYNDLSNLPSSGITSVNGQTTSAVSIGLDDVVAVDPSTTALVAVGQLKVGSGLTPYYLPTADGTPGQVLSTDGSGNISFSTPASGGASDLDGLSDVTITTPASGEILRHNGSGQFVNAQLAYSDLSGTPTLGTASAEDVGTSAGNVVQLDGSARLPAVDGSLLTNLPSGVTDLDGLSDVTITTPTSGEILRHNGSGQFVNAQLAYSDLSGTPTLATVATTGAYTDLSGTPTLGTASAEDVGTSAGNVVQLDGSARLPAVDGSLLTNLPSSGGTQFETVISGSTNYVASSANQIVSLTATSLTNPISFTLPSSPSEGDIMIINRASDANGYQDGSASFLNLYESGGTLLRQLQFTPARGSIIVAYDANNSEWVVPVTSDRIFRDGTGSELLYPSSFGRYVLYADANASNGYTVALQMSASSLLEGAYQRVICRGDRNVTITSPSSDIVDPTGGGASPTLTNSVTVPAHGGMIEIIVNSLDQYIINAPLANLSDVATTGAYTDLSGTPTLGTASAEDVGTSAGNVVQLDGSARLPAVDGSLLTNLPSGGATDLDGLSDVTVTTPASGEVLRHNGSGQFVNTQLAYTDLSGTPTLGTASAEDVGTSAGNVVQLDGSARLPAVDGSLLTNLPSSGGGFTYSAISTDPSPASLDYHYSCTGTFTLTLPATSTGNAGKEIRVKNMGTGTITIDGNLNETIDTQATYDLDIQYSAVTLVSTGSAWEII